MDTVVFADSWEPYFQRLGMRTFDDLYHQSGGLTAGKNARRDVQRFTLGDAEGRNVFFMKRFHHPRLKDVFATAFRFGRLTSQARVEWENARHLLRNGIDTYSPVCMGERCRMGGEIESFFMTQQLDSVCLVDFVLDRWGGLSRTEQEEVVVAVAKFVRRIHDLGVSIPDLYLWHLYIRPDNWAAEGCFSVIDLHRMTRKAPGARGRAKELGRLYWSMSTDYFENEHKALLVTAYMDGRSISDTATCIRAVKRHAAALDR